jgi:hypothetical protein
VGARARNENKQAREKEKAIGVEDEERERRKRAAEARMEEGRWRRKTGMMEREMDGWDGRWSWRSPEVVAVDSYLGGKSYL